MNKISILIITAIITIFIGCVDDGSVEYNEYNITTITPPVDRMGTANEKKVHIGHDLPVNITITSKYAEENVPIQFYLLNVNDVDEVENEVGYISDIRMYYCHRTSSATISQLLEGTNTYGLVINIPTEESKDELTGDFKTGVFYIVGEVNKNEDAEIDAYVVYQKFKDKLDGENIVAITSDYMKKPDLSVESMSFTGGSDDPKDVMIWYNVNLGNLPGISNSGLDSDKMVILVEPSVKDRSFTGTINVKSSSSDALNVPIQFRVENAAGDISVPLEIYDISMNGWVDQYYIPLLKANTTERLTLGLRIPEDTGSYNYFSDWEAWDVDNPDSADYPLSTIRHAMRKENYRDYAFKIVAEINPGGTVTESRFITSNTESAVYTKNDYYESGDIYDSSNLSPTITKENNTFSENLTFTLERVDISPNEGIKAYPYCKIDESNPDRENYRSLVIFWDGIEFNVGDNMFGASAEAHEGMFFYNYSLYSLGIHVSGSVLNNTVYLINTHLNAQSHPYNTSASGFEFHIEGGFKTVLSEAGEGFSENTWQYPILLYSKEKSIEKWFYCFKFKLVAGVETWFTPGVNLGIKEDGSLVVNKTTELRGSVYADASASIAGLASVGLYTYLDIFTLSLIQRCYTIAEYDAVNFPGRVKGTVNRNVGVYLIGPKGYIDLYFEIDFVFFTKRWSKEIFSFTSFIIPLLEMDFAGSGEYTNWIRVEDSELLPLTTSDSN